MSDVKSPQDLSIEEILAKIKSIIAEDDRQVPLAVASPRPAPPAVQVLGADSDDVLELTATIDERGDVHHLAPIGSGKPQIAAHAEPAAEIAGQSMVEPVAVEPVAVEPVAQRDNISSPAEMASAAEPSQPAEVSPAEHEVSPAAQSHEPLVGDRLVSEVASFAAAAAFARLAAVPRPMRPERELPLGTGDRTLEDVVRDLLRPLLQTWLDENLPDIVERLVQGEIARVVVKSETN
ncbi:MAG TPA: DUF2497 domain-containing protein [Stellaceae bacterium]|jgi:hypothetical protein|nr:DUF2497 domain-containing protein [Stellaceae bacterium]